MKAIKVRVWEFARKSWIPYDDLTINRNGKSAEWAWDTEYYCGHGSVDDEIDIQQFTGLLDKNGKEIYEGDILIQEHDLDKDCMYGDETTYMKHHIVTKEHGFFSADEDDKFDLIQNSYNGVNSYVEVVGNIYENPELIKH